MKITDLKKRLGEFQLDIGSMEIEPGLVHGLIGSNGCGKTTLSKLIMGILTPDGGTIDYEGLTARDITMTSQKPSSAARHGLQQSGVSFENTEHAV